mmetsp:Transcript_43177/g.70106  ORF Transcript_43177/g.70106 Transcript_43177/m.70106 type:complete len:475 (+) Transcript_43177:42-1466(+)|eukprot:CAMPEP_0184373120 /NCGR_PEP_ID=MMETSP1089-20130417/164319_1 /TAXON_ID=38269 ORGANISM="Gloeochaete wittrockiana, Strain SAG46.84" /NCGR_SAMPLE_ID=MMETSP1089 /ASSEMBLY_ACC=CAM_ASM_000445 /LENGTH=474 /DNA_ID=CAMNT_0026716031 /DNA_START=768 /DNA_END=2192 /DNA_ORIENTATION=+
MNTFFPMFALPVSSFAASPISINRTSGLSICTTNARRLFSFSAKPARAAKFEAVRVFAAVGDDAPLSPVEQKASTTPTPTPTPIVSEALTKALTPAPPVEKALTPAPPVKESRPKVASAAGAGKSKANAKAAARVGAKRAKTPPPPTPSPSPSSLGIGPAASSAPEHRLPPRAAENIVRPPQVAKKPATPAPIAEEELHLDSESMRMLRSLQLDLQELDDNMDRLEKERNWMDERGMDSSRFAKALETSARRRADLAERLGDARQGYKRIAPSRYSLESQIAEIDRQILEINKEAETLARFGLTKGASKNHTKIEQLVSKRAGLLERIKAAEKQGKAPKGETEEEIRLQASVDSLKKEYEVMQKELEFMESRSLDTRVYKSEMKATEDALKELQLRLFEAQQGIQVFVSRLDLKRDIRNLEVEIGEIAKEQETLERFGLTANKAKNRKAQLGERLKGLQDQLKQAEDRIPPHLR